MPPLKKLKEAFARVIRIDASSATVLLTEAPAPKVRDRKTGEIAKDAMSGEALMTVVAKGSGCGGHA
ncbi:hypothetical protein Sdagh_44930 [Streptomyces daghestanicus]|uniref:Uncharacterized protein n=1 Tax=Streptomyces daghestanicus TaxID=66885 RepID=A0ABQ3Q677_9ACTN|nr:hypothetical protein Sdagh_44930 [Streptomyces daghestanicus]